MRAELQVIRAPSQEAPRLVVRHDAREDFTVYEPAGLKLRWYALTLDLALSTPLDVLIHLPFNRYLERLSAYGQNGRYYVLWTLLAAIPMLLYFIAPTMLWGQTLGKRIVGLRVIRRSFNPELGLGRVILRESLGKLLSIGLVGLGFLLVLTNDRKRALHDYIAGTQVITYRDP